MEQHTVTETGNTITTTMGDLIEAITSVAMKASKNRDEAYLLASLTVQDLMLRNRKLNSSRK